MAILVILAGVVIFFRWQGLVSNNITNSDLDAAHLHPGEFFHPGDDGPVRVATVWVAV